MENMISITSSHEQVTIKRAIASLSNGSRVEIIVENPGSAIRDFVLKAHISIQDISNAYILFPGAVYDGNHADVIMPGVYPPRLENFNQTGPEGPVIMADIPRYNGKLILQTYDLTMPACGIFYDNSYEGIIIKTDTGIAESPYGFELTDGNVNVCFPCIREKRYRHCGRYEEPDDRGLSLGGGELLTFTFDIIESRAKNRSEFAFEISSLFLGDFEGRPFGKRTLADKCIEKVNRDEFNVSEGFYMDSSESKRFQIGWVSGIITAYSMLLTDSTEYHERAAATISFVLEEGISPCGLPMGFYDDKGWRGLEFWDRLDFAAVHIRRIMDAIFYMFRIIRLGKLHDQKLINDLKNLAISSCDRLSKMVDEYGHFGHSVNLNDGSILWGGSAAGVTGISCLCECYKMTGNAYWLNQAEAAGNYYSSFNDTGCWYGGPGDILMAPDSESNYAAMDAFYLLYETTGNDKWKGELLKAAMLMSTWVCMADYSFPEDSSYGKLGIRTKGLVMANSQNKHLGPGICTSSGNMLKKAASISGDSSFSIIYKMIADAAFGMAEAFNGNIPENINVADSLCDRGEFYSGHGIWIENACIMMALEEYNE